jgi:proteasome activator subunit 4
MKSLRYIKLRTFCHDSAGLALMQNHNPLKEEVKVQPSQLFTTNFLQGFKTAVDIDTMNREPCVQEDILNLIKH